MPLSVVIIRSKKNIFIICVERYRQL